MDKIYEITKFKTLYLRQQRTIISKRCKTNEVNSPIATVVCLESFRTTVRGGVGGGACKWGLVSCQS